MLAPFAPIFRTLSTRRPPENNQLEKPFKIRYNTPAMNTTLYILFGLIVILLLTAVVWRLASRRQSLPCPAALRWMVELDNPFTKTNRAAVILDLLNLKPGMVVLDVGCGPGRLTLPAAKQVGPHGRITAMDIQQAMLDRTRQKAQDAGLTNIDYLCAAAGEGRLEPGCFDCALLVTVLGEIPDQQPALQEIFRALKPGAILSVTEVIFDPHFQRRSTVKQLTETAGFRQTACFGTRFAYTMHLQKPGT